MMGWQLIVFIGVLVFFAVLFALSIILPFVRHLNKRLEFDRERSEACHNFQKELNRQTLLGFTKVSEALNLNTQVLNAFMERTARDSIADNAPGGSVRT